MADWPFLLGISPPFLISSLPFSFSLTVFLSYFSPSLSLGLPLSFFLLFSFFSFFVQSSSMEDSDGNSLWPNAPFGRIQHDRTTRSPEPSRYCTTMPERELVEAHSSFEAFIAEMPPPTVDSLHHWRMGTPGAETFEARPVRTAGGTSLVPRRRWWIVIM